MSELIVQYVQKAVAAITPWLVGTAVGFFFLWLAMLIREKKPFAKELKWFSGLAPLHKFIVVCVVSFFTLWGGSKERGILPPGLIDDISSTVSRVVETIQLRTLPENVASNAFAVTDFAVDSQGKETAFGVGWASNLFENVDSRNVDLFMSTNLAVNGWFPLGRYLMPQGTNAYAFTISSNDVALAYRPIYVDSFSRMAFFRFGLDFDSDGDGLTDSYESFVSFTDPSNPDTDSDGLSDAQELAINIGTNPLLYDTDGDGVGDGDEIAAGSNPHSADTDGDELLDVAELGTMTALTEENFMWFDMSNGTDLLATSSTEDDRTWQIALPQNAIINEACYTNALVCMNGVVHLLCPTNSGGKRYSGYSYSNLGNYEWSAMHVTVALCNSDLYARKTEWGSKILYGSVEYDGRIFGVVEYRNIGLHSLRNATSNELMTCQLIIPSDETNTVYVSYLCASNSFRSINLVVGLQCGGVPSCKTGEEYYNLTWPLSPQFPEDGLTIKYSIGTGTNPTLADTDGDGFSDPDEIFTYHTNPFVADMDGDGLLDAEEFIAGTDHLNPDTDGDGIPDGWEVHNGINPLLDDAMLDPDRDGLVNLLEYENGTNPLSEDSDGDMLVDLREVATYTTGVTNVPWFVFQPIKTVVPDTEKDRALFDCVMPFTNRLAGSRIELALADINGAVYFGTPSTTNGIASSDGGVNLEVSQGKWCPIVAGYWSDLKTRISLNSSISFGLATTNDEQYFVVEFSRIGTYSGNGNEVSFQISIPRTTPDIAYVRYGNILDGRTSGNTTIGIQGGKEEGFPNSPRLNYYYKSVPPVLTNGFALAFNFGTGGSPLVADTDGDGLDDRIEAEIGTNPRREDTDGDGFTDTEEIGYGMNPCSAIGRDGAEGDLDGDGLANGIEASFGTSLMIPDCDGDGLPDGTETGFIAVSNGLPWLTFDVAEDCTTQLVYDVSHKYHVNRSLPTPMMVQGELVTNVTFTSRGWLFLNRAGLGDQWRYETSFRFDYVVDEDTLAIAAYGDNLSVRTDAGERSTMVRFGTATHDGVGYIVLEYDNLYRELSSYTTNSISMQVAIPTNTADCAYVRYRDVMGGPMDGRNCGIGMQTFDGKWLHSYCYSQYGKVYDGLCLHFVFGTNTDPLDKDSDGDGLADGNEVENLTDPRVADTDGDGLPDGWEVANETDPLSAFGDDGGAGDGDGDGLPNCLEYIYGTNAAAVDSDGDGLVDGNEVVDIYENDALPWLSISSPTEMCCLASNQWECADFQLPTPVVVQGETVTNITIDAHGIIYLNRTGHVNSLYARSSASLEYEIDKDCFVLAPYLSNLSFADLIGPSRIKAGSATDGTNGYIVVEYSKMYYYPQWGDTNVVSFQVSIPTGVVHRVNVKYVDVYGDDMDGRSAVIGLQTFGFRNHRQYCYYDYEKVHDGLGLVFLLGYGTDPNRSDTDGDGVSDGDEINVHGCNPLLNDTDGDGLNDALELTLGTSPTNTDNDGDGLPDGWEHANGLDPSSLVGDDGAAGDPDHDGLPNAQEFALGGDPQDPNSDEDDLTDGQEVLIGTSVTSSDTDGDGLSDSDEVTIGTNPLLVDSDNDGLTDGFETQYGFNPLTVDNPNLDSDGDGVSDIDEQRHGTNPNAKDTDLDGLEDGDEINIHKTNPTLEDTDRDGIPDAQELTLNLDPKQPDSDNDGMNDGWEYRYRNRGFDPAVDNKNDGNTLTNPGYDMDGDGLSNADECAFGTDPGAKDSDGDGVFDGDEVTNASDPTDGQDNGQPNSRRRVRFYFGDDSGSHSEKYQLQVTPLSGPSGEATPSSFAWINENYGQGEWKTAMLKPGWKYSVRLQWISCKEPQQDGVYPNYDYTLKCESDDCCVIKDDPSGLFKVDYYGGQFYGTSSFPVLDCEAYVLALDLKHERLWETSNKSNRIFNDTPKDDFSGETVCETDEQGYIWSAHRNELYVVSDKASNTFNVTEKLQPLSIPQEYVSNVMCAAFDGMEPIPGSATHLSSQYEAVMQIQAPQSATIVHYQIRAGIDSDNDGELSYSESVPLEVYKYQGQRRYAGICGTTSAQCDAFDTYIGDKLSGLVGLGTSVALPVGQSFLSIFHNGNDSAVPGLWRTSVIRNATINAFATKAGFSEWLTHNSGAGFNDEGVATITEYVWPANSEMAQFMAMRTPLAPWISYTVKVSASNGPIMGIGGFENFGLPGYGMTEQTVYQQTETGNKLMRFFQERVLPEAVNRLAGRGDGATETLFPSSDLWTDEELASILFTSMSSTQISGITQEIGVKGNYGGVKAVLDAGARSLITGGPQLSDLDAFFSIGRGRLLNFPSYSFTVRKTTHWWGEPTYDLVRIGFSCTIQDLYDFNFEDGALSKNAAGIQIGYGCGSNSRTHGQIYRHEIQINTTYENPFVR